MLQVEHSHPGFTYDLVMRLVHKADLSVNMNEAILRLQGGVSDQDSLEYRSSRTEEPFQDSAANRLIGEFVQSRRRPLLGPSPG